MIAIAPVQKLHASSKRTNMCFSKSWHLKKPKRDEVSETQEATAAGLVQSVLGNAPGWVALGHRNRDQWLHSPKPLRNDSLGFGEGLNRAGD